MSKMEFLSGGGKTFELARLLANAVLRRGGSEYSIDDLLRPKAKAKWNDMADIIVGRSVAVQRPLKEIIEGDNAGGEVQIWALRELKDLQYSLRIALSCLSMEAKQACPIRFAVSGDLWKVAVDLVIEAGWEKSLLSIAMDKGGLEMGSEPKYVTGKINDPALLRQILEGSRSQEAQRAAAEKLPDEILLQIIDESDNCSKTFAASRIRNRSTLERLENDPRPHVRNGAKDALHFLRVKDHAAF